MRIFPKWLRAKIIWINVDRTKSIFRTAPNWGDRAELLVDKGTNMSFMFYFMSAFLSGWAQRLQRGSPLQLIAAFCSESLRYVLSNGAGSLAKQLLFPECSIPEKPVLMGHKNKLLRNTNFFFFLFLQHDSLEHDMVAVLLIKSVKWSVSRELQPPFHTVLIWIEEITWNVTPNENTDRVTCTVLLFSILWLNMYCVLSTK